jgi:hypothetical protein
LLLLLLPMCRLGSIFSEKDNRHGVERKHQHLQQQRQQRSSSNNINVKRPAV